MEEASRKTAAANGQHRRSSRTDSEEEDAGLKKRKELSAGSDDEVRFQSFFPSSATGT